MALPGNSEPLLIAISLEDMEVLIHPQRQELIVNPPQAERKNAFHFYCFADGSIARFNYNIEHTAI
jgi:hypothetical protein